MESITEEKILNNLIEVNLDACCFYREAAGKTEVLLAERTFHDLERIHSGIVENLALAAYRNGNTCLPESARGKKKKTIFGNLRMVAHAGLISAVENAETRCIEILEKAIDSDEVSTDIKMHVLSAVTMLSGRHEHLHRLKTLVA